jgi:parallel beta-helix repeat protein
MKLSIRRIFRCASWFAPTVLIFIPFSSAFAVDEQIEVASAGILVPGIAEGTGTHFEIVRDGVVDVALDSSEPVTVLLQFESGMLAFDIEAASSATFTQLTLSGLDPTIEYYLYQDSHRNVTVFQSDLSGGYTFIQDIAEPHHLFIQTQPSTHYIPSDTSIGTWNPETRVFTLTRDVAETIEFEEHSMTLDGNGYTLFKPGTSYYGILLSRSGVTIKNLTVDGGGGGGTAVYLGYRVQNNVLMNNTIRNTSNGVITNWSSNNLIEDNIVEYNSRGLWIKGRTGRCVNNRFHGNTIRHNVNGLWLWRGCTGNLIEGNDISSNRGGLSGAGTGIVLTLSDGNIVRGNTVDSNGSTGIFIHWSESNLITSNTISNTFAIGSRSSAIVIEGTSSYWARFNTISKNIISNSARSGIIISTRAWDNLIYDNYFYNDLNFDSYYFGGWPNSWNVERVEGTNILGGPYLGGNYWSTPSETGFSDLCDDADRDEICDSHHVLASNNVDQLPLTKERHVAPVWPEGSVLNDTSVGLTWVLLTWTPAVHENGVTEYQIYMDGVIKEIVPGDTTSLKVVRLDPNTEYLFKVEACEARGLCSEDGPSLSVRTLTPAEAIQELINLVTSLNLGAGIDNSLDAKLGDTQRALIDLNEKNDISVINRLQAFILETEAQSGHMIPEDDANRLIAAAQEIILVLEGS